MKDWRGTPIEVGSHVVYAVTHSSNVTMVEGRVVAVREEPHPWRRDETVPVLDVERLVENYWKAKEVENKKVTLRAVHRVTVVPAKEAE